MKITVIPSDVPVSNSEEKLVITCGDRTYIARINPGTLFR
jgi:hypothetical protein